MTPESDGPVGFLVVDKPSGVTSHDVVGRVRALLGTRRVGHAGTLDPMATGVLILAAGRATKLLGHLSLADKSYRATIRLGVATDTDDADGEPLAVRSAAGVSDRDIRHGMTSFHGELDQVPSTYSAVKINGRRAYERARAGEEVVLPARRITIHRYELLGEPRRNGETVDLDVEVVCSSGTYIRALARDLGAELGVGGHLTALRRVTTGPFTLEGALDAFPDGVTPRGAPRPPISDELRERAHAALIPVAQVAQRAFAVRNLDAHESSELAFGRPISAASIPGVYAGCDAHGNLVALLKNRAATSVPVLVWQAAN